MTGKTKNRLKWIPSLFFAVFLCFSITMKLAHAPQLVALYSKIGLQDQVVGLAIMEATFLSLFLWPRTMRLGFFLLTGYYGGAMGIELSLGMVPMAPATVLAIVWLGALLRDPALFYVNGKQHKTMAL